MLLFQLRSFSIRSMQKLLQNETWVSMCVCVCVCVCEDELKREYTSRELCH